MHQNKKLKIVFVSSSIILILMSLISVGLQAQFLDNIDSGAQDALGLGKNLRGISKQFRKDDFRKYYQTLIGLIVLDCLVIVLSIYGLSITLTEKAVECVKDYHANIYIIFGGLVLMTRLLLSIVYLVNPDETYVNQMKILYLTKMQDFTNLDYTTFVYITTWYSSYYNEMAQSLIIPVFQLIAAASLWYSQEKKGDKHVELQKEKQIVIDV